MTLRRSLFAVLALALLPFSGISAQTPTNAVTRGQLQNGTFDLLGTYRFAGSFYPPAVFVDPPGCVVPPAGSVRMIINLTENVIKVCSAAGVWTTIGSASIPSPYTLNQVFSGTVGFTGIVTHSGAETFSSTATFNSAANFTSTATFTGTTDIKRQNTIEVCKSGCTFSSVNSAVQSITTSSSTNRYEVRVGCGDYDETVNLVSGSTPISYITIRGVDRNCVRIRGSINTGTIRTQSKDTTGIILDNITVGGGIPVLLNGLFGTGATRTSFQMTNVILGIIDGTENASAGKSIDGFVSSTNAKNRDIYLSNSICYSTFDCVRPMEDETYYGNGNVLYIDDKGATTTAEPWSLSKGGGQIYENGSTVIIIRTASGPGKGLYFGPTTAGGTRPSIIHVANTNIFLSTSGSPAANDLRCISLEATPALLAGSRVEFENVNCYLTDASNTWNLYGIQAGANDADYANGAVIWNGGSIVRSGGASFSDFNSAITQAGFSTTISSLIHSGTYGGAGTQPVYGNSSVGKFGLSFTGPTIAAAAPTVSGEISYDTTANDLEYGDNGTNRKVANLDEVQTFTNKTLTAPIISTISNTGTVTLFTSTDTVVGKATSDILTNKTLTAPLITLADLVVGTCTAGQIGIDNGGATKEWCVCGTTNTWGCWKLTDGTFNANGPAD